MGIALPAADIRIRAPLQQIQRRHLVFILDGQEQRQIEDIQTAINVRDAPETIVDVLGGVDGRGVRVGPRVEEELDGAQIALFGGVHEPDAFVVFDVEFDQMARDVLVAAAVEEGHRAEGSRGGSRLCDLQDQFGWEVFKPHRDVVKRTWDGDLVQWMEMRWRREVVEKRQRSGRLDL